MASLITVEGGAKKMEKAPTFKECYALVGCQMLEVVRLWDGSILLVDEEGLCKEAPVINPIATQLSGQLIVGNAVLLNKAEAKKALR